MGTQPADMAQPGDGKLLAWSHGTGEPRALTRRIVEGGAVPDSVFCGVAMSDTAARLLDRGSTVITLGAMGHLRPLAHHPRLRVLVDRWSRFPGYFRGAALPVGTFLANLPPAQGGSFSFGASGDYTQAALARADRVLVQWNDRLPVTHSPSGPCGTGHDSPAEALAALRSKTVLEVTHSQDPIELPGPPISDVDRGIGALVASLVEQGSTIEIGIGSLGTAVCAGLFRHRGLTVHSGMLFDGIVDLAEAGALASAPPAGALAPITGGVLFGSRRLYRFAHRNDDISFESIDSTHDVGRMGGFDRFVAINSALSVDLTGQVNSETAGTAQIGAVGGVLDFCIGAQASPAGKAIIALRATNRRGDSAIVPGLDDGVVTIPRGLVDFIVTEYGIADLRGATLDERRRRMVGIAHPRHRKALANGA